LPQRLKDEASGILRWAVEGLAEYQTSGLNEPPTVKDATAEYRRDQDAIGQFLSACCVVERDAGVKARPLYDAYKEWAKETEEWVMNERQFSQALSERDGLQKVKHASGNLWKGIGLAAGRRGDEDGLPF
jgi:putative DNA primase/helicase